MRHKKPRRCWDVGKKQMGQAPFCSLWLKVDSWWCFFVVFALQHFGDMLNQTSQKKNINNKNRKEPIAIHCFKFRANHFGELIFGYNNYIKLSKSKPNLVVVNIILGREMGIDSHYSNKVHWGRSCHAWLWHKLTYLDLPSVWNLRLFHRIKTYQKGRNYNI